MTFDIRALVASSSIGFMVVALASSCLADTIYFNDEGRKNVAALRLRIAPAEVFEDPVQKLLFIRGVITAARGARDRSASYQSVDGSPEYEFIAFDGAGEQRSRPVTISHAWVHHIVPQIDNELDVRALFSDRDRVAGVGLGSRTYFAMARRAADPDGKLGLWRADIPLPPEPPGVTEGTVIRFIRDGFKVQEAAWLESAKRAVMERQPTAHLLPAQNRPNAHVRALIEAIARERAYRLSRSGFDRTALSMLVFILDLDVGSHGEGPRAGGPGPAPRLSFGNIAGVHDAVTTIQAATPTAPAPDDPLDLTELLDRYRASKDPAEAQRLTAEYEARHARVAAERRTACAQQARFCVDPSERAAVAIDALMTTEGLYAPLWLHKWLVDALVEMQTTPTGPRPRRDDRIDLRDPAWKLLTQVVNPPRGTEAASEQRRQAYARLVRERLREIMIDDRSTADASVAAREALAAGGWGSAEELSSLVRTLLDAASHFASDASRSSASARGSSMRAQASRYVASLRAIAELSGSPVDAERRAAAQVLDHVDKMRRLRNDGRASGADKIVLEIWDTLPSGTRAR